MSVMPMSAVTRFKTPEGADKFFAAYDATLALWPVPHEAIEVTTSFGTTLINVAGSPDLPPLLLIHGNQVSSSVWYANIEPLSRHFRVYAPDVIDQMGLSVPKYKLKTASDYADWMGEVLDALHLDRVTVIGHSHGGWQALNLAIRSPQRVERLVLLSPAPAILRLKMQLLLRMLPIFVRPTRAMFYRYFQWLTTMPLDENQPHTLIEQMMLGALSYKPQELSIGVVTVFTDDELRQIDKPTLLLVGECEVVYDPAKALARARRLMPQVEAELIAGGGHLFPVDQADATNARILKFLSRDHQ